MEILQKRNGKFHTIITGSGNSGSGGGNNDNRKWTDVVDVKPSSVPEGMPEGGLLIVKDGISGSNNGNNGQDGADGQNGLNGAPYNTREILTTSGTYTAPVDGWYKITLIGGGGGGAGGHYSTQYNYSASGGGGGSGAMKTIYMYLRKNNKYSYTIGAGGSGGPYSTVENAVIGNHGGTTFFNGESAPGGSGAGRTGLGMGYAIAIGGFAGGDGKTSFGFNGQSGQQTNLGAMPGLGGGFNGGVIYQKSDGAVPVAASGYGGGGCGGWAQHTNTVFRSGGSAGYQGCVILEYYDPAKAA